MPERWFRLSIHWKNEEQKKYVPEPLPLSIKLTKEVMVFRVSIVVSIPLSIFLSTPIVSLHALQTRLQARALPPSWIIAQTAMDSLMLIVPSASMSVRCPACVRHWASLLVQHQCLQNSSENVQPSNSVNYRYLSMPQLVSWLQNIHHDNRLLSKQCKWLTQKIEEDCRWTGVDVDDAMHDGLI